MITRPVELSTGQLAALYLEALRRAGQDPESAIAARNLGIALDRRRGRGDESQVAPAAST